MKQDLSLANNIAFPRKKVQVTLLPSPAIILIRSGVRDVAVIEHLSPVPPKSVRFQEGPSQTALDFPFCVSSLLIFQDKFD